MSETKIKDGISKVRYLGIDEVITKMEEIGNNNIAIGKKFENEINSFKSDKSLSSKVITPEMEKMIKKINDVNNEMKKNIDEYCTFLREEVKKGYMTGDEEIKTIWNEISKLFEGVKE